MRSYEIISQCLEITKHILVTDFPLTKAAVRISMKKKPSVHILLIRSRTRRGSRNLSAQIAS